MDHQSTTKPFLTQLNEARASEDRTRFGSLLQGYRPWLLLLARLELDGPLRAKLDPSDIVQETLLHAFRDRNTFRGSTEKAFAAWLRSILAHALAREVRRFRKVKKRDLAMEASIREHMESTSIALANLTAQGTSPSGRMAKEEEGVLLARALASLPQDYREVIILRSLEDLPYQEVARRMERSEGSARMLWLRALSQLKRALETWNP